MEVTQEQRSRAKALIDFIDLSPSPWHAADAMEAELRAAGFTSLKEDESWSLERGGSYYVTRGGSSLIAFRIGTEPVDETGFRIIGAHTDSPGLRLKPNASHSADGLIRLGVEVYGGPILATFADRDLSFAGRVWVNSERKIESRLVRIEAPLFRLPNLAIHMNRAVNERGLKFAKQTELPLFLGIRDELVTPADEYLGLLAKACQCSKDQILSTELNVYDTQKGSFWGVNGEFIADSQIDNLSSCRAALSALVDVGPSENTLVTAFFDHEEVGSESHKGADGTFLTDTLERVCHVFHVSGTDYRRALAKSLLVSADAAHAHNPNFPSAYEPLHTIGINRGPAIKVNVNQRYATDGMTEARLAQLFIESEIPFQKYVHRSDLACGSTIGPISAARLGIATVDLGCPMWAMHSVRESAGVLDQTYLFEGLKLFFSVQALP